MIRSLAVEDHRADIAVADGVGARGDETVGPGERGLIGERAERQIESVVTGGPTTLMVVAENVPLTPLTVAVNERVELP